jgi:small-conductance mechanosensitive channel
MADKEKEQKETQKEKGIRERTTSELVKLMTASFGLVAALAWNQVIQELVNNYIKPVFGKNSGLISLTIYAIFITIFVVIVTYFLGGLVKKD